MNTRASLLTQRDVWNGKYKIYKTLLLAAYFYQLSSKIILNNLKFLDRHHSRFLAAEKDVPGGVFSFVPLVGLDSGVDSLSPSSLLSV